jgi:hypothetical protein
VLRVMSRDGHVVEATPTAEAAMKRLVRSPPIELALVGGLSDRDRSRVMGAARSVEIWCAYLAVSGVTPRFSPDERSHLLASVDATADDERIANAIRVLIRARRHPGEGRDDTG